MLEQWDGQSPIGEIQDQKLATKAPRLKRTDGNIDFKRSAVDIANQIRAFQPWPGTFTSWTPAGKSEVRLIIHQAAVVTDQPGNESHAPGEVIVSDKQNLIVQTGAGQLSLLKVQPAGKKPMPVADFLRGNPPPAGQTLGS